MLDLAQKIAGKRIYLQKHEKTIKQAQKMLNLVNKSFNELEPWLDWVTKEYVLENAYEYIIYCADSWEKGSDYNYAIYLNDGTIIGNISLLAINDKHNHAEIGYWMATAFAGNGYMQEAVEILGKEAFGKGLHKIIIRTDVLNHKSANVAIKSGYILDGIMREDMYSKLQERYRDTNVFSKINPNG